MPTSKKKSVKVLIACALQPEAKAIITEYDLQFVHGEYGFKLYGSKPDKLKSSSIKQDEICVLVAGVGKVNMAAGMMWVRQICQFDRAVNIGLAGHGSQPIGSIILVNQIIDEATQQAYYPSINFRWNGQQSALKTLGSPSDSYSLDYVFDMEASAFFDIVNRSLTSDKIHVLKVVSDNPNKPFTNLDKQSLHTCFSAALKALTLLLEIIDTDNREDGELETLMQMMSEQWHLTVTRKIQLKETLSSIAVMEKNTSSQGPDWQSYKSVTTYLKDCEKWLQNIKPKIS